MMTITLVTDSTCNLPPTLAAERHIYVAPLYVIWGDESYRDGIDITEEELFDRLAKMGTKDELPKTSQVVPQDFVTLFEQARAAENADEIVCAVLFMVESLDYLHAGGRIGGAARLVGTALNIKPILEVTNEGVINAADKVRTRKRAVGHLLKLAAQQAGGAAIKRLAVIHSGAPEDADALLAQAREKLDPQEHYRSFITAVLGAHVGPGALGIIINWTAG